METNYDDIRELDNKLPKGWFLFFVGIIAWGLFYIASYTPEISGWTQSKAVEQELAVAQAKPKPVLTENPFEQDPGAKAEGKVIYMDNCAGCHSDNLKGGVGPDLTGHLKYGESDKDKYTSVAKGTQAGMPAFEQQLGRDKIWKALAYVDSVREYGAKP